MPLKTQTNATFQQLEAAKWFSKVGVRDVQNAIVLDSWENAIKSCVSPKWENLCLEANNQYCERLIERSPIRFSEWNSVVDNVKKFSIPLVNRKTSEVVQKHDLPKSFVDTVEWDILGVLMESEYADVYPPGFYASQAYWYVKGHFPCGWEGEFPQGTLVIF